MKKCRGCGAEKPLEAFYRFRQSKDGRNPRCADCVRKRNAEWRAVNAEKHRAINAAWDQTNADRKRAQERAWRERYADKERLADAERRHRRRARKRQATVGALDLDALWTESGGLCGICQLPIDRALRWPHPASASIDHILPLSKGGAHSQENAQWAHLRCNLRKGDRLAV